MDRPQWSGLAVSELPRAYWLSLTSLVPKVFLCTHPSFHKLLTHWWWLPNLAAHSFCCSTCLLPLVVTLQLPECGTSSRPREVLRPVCDKTSSSWKLDIVWSESSGCSLIPEDGWMTLTSAGTVKTLLLSFQIGGLEKLKTTCPVFPTELGEGSNEM